MVTISTGKIYSNGVDLAWVSKQSRDVMMEFSQALCNIIGRILTFPLPTIAAVNGKSIIFHSHLNITETGESKSGVI